MPYFLLFTAFDANFLLLSQSRPTHFRDVYLLYWTNLAGLQGVYRVFSEVENPVQEI